VDARRCRDVRVIELCEDFSLTLEASQALGSLATDAGSTFDHHLALKVGVRGAVDLTHASHTNFVVTSYPPMRCPKWATRENRRHYPKWREMARRVLRNAAVASDEMRPA
jgi:hypothetical protein